MHEIDNSIKRYKEITDIIQGDDDAVGLLNDIVRSAEKYVSHVINTEVALKMIWANYNDCENIKVFDRQEYKEKMENFDSTRRIYHNTLMDNINIFNRYLSKKYEKKTPVGGIYSLSPETLKNRDAVGDWALYFLTGLKQLNSS
jgi:hypothetical protein